MFAASLAVALLDTVIPLFIGRLVSIMEATDRQRALLDQWPLLAGMVGLILVIRPRGDPHRRRRPPQRDHSRRHQPGPLAEPLARHPPELAVLPERLRRPHRAARDADRHGAARATMVEHPRGLVHRGVRGGRLRPHDARRLAPRPAAALAWVAGYVVFLRHFVPRLRDLSRASSEARSLVMARVVDSYTNILTVKLFAQLADEDAYVRESIDAHQRAMGAHMATITRFMFILHAMNALLLVGTGSIGIALWAQGTLERRHRRHRAAARLADRQCRRLGELRGQRRSSRTSAWCRKACSRSPCRTAPSTATMREPLEVSRGEIRFENVTFGYGRTDTPPVIDGLTLDIRAGERVGLVGRSGAGKSTLVNLLLRFYSPEGGRILDRRPGHRRRDAGKSALGDRHGDAGHLAAAPLDRRQHPLRQAERERRTGDRGRHARAGARVRHRPARLAGAHAATPRTSASAV